MKQSLSYRECYQVLGRRTFFRAFLWGMTFSRFPRGYDPAAEIWQRHMELRAREVLGD